MMVTPNVPFIAPMWTATEIWLPSRSKPAVSCDRWFEPQQVLLFVSASACCPSKSLRTSSPRGDASSPVIRRRQKASTSSMFATSTVQIHQATDPPMLQCHPSHRDPLRRSYED